MPLENGHSLDEALNNAVWLNSNSSTAVELFDEILETLGTEFPLPTIREHLIEAFDKAASVGA